MSVLLKYQLKALFESGDLMTQDSLFDLIDSTYNPTLVAGTNITLGTVVTPAGTTITVNAAGGGSGVVTTLTTTGTSGLATLAAGTLNIPNYTNEFSSLTTTGTSGAATLVGGVLNIPNYSTGGIGSYTNASATPQSFPGIGSFANIAADTTFSNQTFTEMMNQMLYPTLDPTLTAPSATLSISPPATYQEIGLTTGVTLTANFNRGSISPQYTSTSAFRSGVPITYNFSGTGVTTVTTSSTGPVTATSAGYGILIGSNTWTNSVSFEAGVMPKDSNDNDFDPPGALAAGTSATLSKSIIGVYPVFATTTNITTLTKQSLQSMAAGGYPTGGTIEVSIVNENFFSPSNRQEVDIPDAWATITGVETFDSIVGGGTWISTPLTDWTQSATSHVIQTVTVPYTKYKNNIGFPKGAAQYRFLT